jgi:ParB family transcriptional regulator, chromosome partitioning protein
LADVAGVDVANGNAKEIIKTQKDILRDCLEGRNGRSAPDSWVQKRLRFLQGGYLANEAKDTAGKCTGMGGSAASA